MLYNIRTYKYEFCELANFKIPLEIVSRLHFVRIM